MEAMGHTRADVAQRKEWLMLPPVPSPCRAGPWCDGTGIPRGAAGADQREEAGAVGSGAGKSGGSLGRPAGTTRIGQCPCCCSCGLKASLRHLLLSDTFLTAARRAAWI